MLLAMPASTAILLLFLIFKNQDLIVFALGFQGTGHRGALHKRLSNEGFGFGFDEKYILELDRSTGLRFELFDPDDIPFRNAVLLSAAHYHCIHGLTSLGEIADLTKNS